MTIFHYSRNSAAKRVAVGVDISQIVIIISALLCDIFGVFSNFIVPNSGVMIFELALFYVFVVCAKLKPGSHRSFPFVLEFFLCLIRDFFTGWPLGLTFISFVVAIGAVLLVSRRANSSSFDKSSQSGLFFSRHNILLCAMFIILCTLVKSCASYVAFDVSAYALFVSAFKNLIVSFVFIILINGVIFSLRRS